ncbi:MAG: lysine-sensitive aspartokinase 3 [Candidatus Woesearchaeota archaeon]|nr:lysine-sensitive aspartokinase 3 [Candidatus Woesearchaeota archaeon]
MIVMKFGGTSVGSAERIKIVHDIVKSRLDRDPIVVVSAVGGITDKLINTANLAFQGGDYSAILNEIKEKHYTIIKELGLGNSLVQDKLDEFEQLIGRIAKYREVTTETMDLVQSFGERMSARIVAAYMTKHGMEAEAHDAYDVGLVTNDNFGGAEPLPESEEQMRMHLSDKKAIPIITGFIGKTSGGAITTLGRGGSDYSAAIVGAALNVEEIQIWTDVNGIMTTDPKIVKEAKTIDKVSFNEAAELAYFGAKVLHPKTILPAMRKNIPVRVLNTYEPSNEGTLIVNEPSRSEKIAKAIAVKRNITVITINSTRMIDAYGFLAKIFDIFRKYHVVVDMVSTSEVSVSVTVDKKDNLDKAIVELNRFATVNIEENKSIVCVVGEGLHHIPNVVGPLFSVLGRNNINIEMISQGASEINIGFVVKAEDAENAVRALHKEFFG